MSLLGSLERIAMLVLYSKLKGYKVVTPTGDKIGGLKDLYVDTTSTPWKVESLAIASRRVGKAFVHSMSEVQKIEKPERYIELMSHAEREPLPRTSKPGAMSIVDLKKRKFVDEEGGKVGKLGDVAVHIGITPWTIEKLIIDVGVGKRRLRLDPENVKTIKQEVVLEASSIQGKS